jgi:hypothetical protein
MSESMVSIKAQVNGVAIIALMPAAIGFATIYGWASGGLSLVLCLPRDLLVPVYLEGAFGPLGAEKVWEWRTKR